jgi:hypothetical protein
VTGFAVDPFAFTGIDGVVADETDHAVGQDRAKQEVGMQDAPLDAGPGDGGEDALIAVTPGLAQVARAYSLPVLGGRGPVRALCRLRRPDRIRNFVRRL